MISPLNRGDFSPSDLLGQIDADFPGLWSRIEKAQPWSKAPSFPVVTQPAARNYPPGTKHPRGYPIEYLMRANGTSAQEIRQFQLSGIDPKSVFVSYSAEALQAVAAWRTTKLHYVVDADLWDELSQTPMKGTPPSQVFEYLPAKSFFISRKGGLLRKGDAALHRRDGDASVHGYFVYVLPGSIFLTPVTSTTITGRLALRLGSESIEDALDRVVQEMKESSLNVIRAHPNGTEFERQKAVADLLARWPKEEESIRSEWHGVLSNILYLCTEQPDVEGKSLPCVKMTRLGSRVRFSVPTAETVVGVGVRLGSVFRKAANERAESDAGGFCKPVMPHIRRAHWHTYWTGKKGEKRPEVKWLSPILVNAKSANDLAETVHRVADTSLLPDFR